MNRYSSMLMAGCAALALAAGSSSAFAQATNGSDIGLAEVVVTATRTGETNLQKTPVAVTAFSPKALAEHGVTTLLNLNGLAPNVSIGSRSGDGQTAGVVSIRGIGFDANAPAQPGVGIYVDDVYIPGEFGNLLGAYDLASLDVLRGPQGTLFGRNTIGGALQYTSVKPKIGDFSGFLDGTAGNRKHGDIAGGVNVPLGDWAALRISGADTNIDGYLHDILNNVNRGSAHNTDARIQLLMQPTSNLSVNLKFEAVTQRSNGAVASPVGFTNTFNQPPLVFFAPPGFYNQLVQYISPSYYTTYGANAPESFHSNLKIGQGVISYDISPDLKVKSITAYSRSASRFLFDGDGSPLAIFGVDRGLTTNKLFTQEFQLAGKSFGEHLHWTLGAYYYHEEYLNEGSAGAIFNTPPVQQFGSPDVKTTSYAAYGQGTYNLTDQLSIVGGLRYTDDKGVLSNPTAVPGQQTGSTRATKVSPLIGVNYQVTQDVLFYAKWSRGYRGGSFYPNAFSTGAFSPETLESYEIGARMEFLDRRVRINPTVFWTNWNNIQFNSSATFATPTPPFVTSLPTVQNAGNAVARGAELESQFAVTKQFTVTANAAYLTGHYTDIAKGIDVTTSTPLQRAPKWSYTIGGRYEIPAWNGRIALNGNYVWQDTQRSAVGNNTNFQIPAYGLLNGRLAYTAPGNTFVIALYANNLAGKKYRIGGVNFGPGGVIPTLESDVGPPREYGVNLRYNFN